MAWDRSSNVTLVQDEVFQSGVGADMDTEFTMDDLDRLTRAQWGTYTTSIGSEWRDQNWVLDQAGNWEDVNLDLDADGAFTSAGEYDDDRVHEQANNLTERALTMGVGTSDFDLVYNQRGDLIDDNEHFKYVWDVWGRLTKVTNAVDTTVAEYTYNGLNHLIARLEDTDDDGDADGNDVEFRHLYDDQWRIVATFRDDDSDPKEQFVYHCAGADGMGGSSYIDAIVLRDKDADTEWTSAGDGALEHRVYYIQNWRADVVAAIEIEGAGVEMVEWVRYDPYGTPYGMPMGDTNGDATVNGTDTDNIVNQWWGDNDKPTADTNLDGTIDVLDLLTVNGGEAWGDTLGWGMLSLDEGSANNRKGYAGYEHLSSLAGGYVMWHVRYRVLNSELGRWITRDPLGYQRLPTLYAYVALNPLAFVDPSGTAELLTLVAGGLRPLAPAIAATGPAAAVVAVVTLAILFLFVYWDSVHDTYSIAVELYGLRPIEPIQIQTNPIGDMALPLPLRDPVPIDIAIPIPRVRAEPLPAPRDDCIARWKRCDADAALSATVCCDGIPYGTTMWRLCVDNHDRKFIFECLDAFIACEATGGFVDPPMGCEPDWFF